MKHGFTTGSCSAAAAKAATYMLLSGIKKEKITIETPKGIPFDAELVDISMGENQVSCAVIKDGGDDPDVTTGAHVYATVAYDKKDTVQIRIVGGIGVGRVTRPGLDQPVGEAAINSVPRQMITKEVSEVCELFDCKDGLTITISIPEGVELAEKTFNPRLGIEGGISVLGTSGVVEPMSTQALLDTIAVELKQKYAMGYRKICITPGNYGLDFMKSAYDFDLDFAVKCSNFIGNTLDLISGIGFTDVLLVGHIGKLVKVAGGIMNTHSREADCRMEILSASAIRCGLPVDISKEILECLTTEEALEKIGNYEEVMRDVMDHIHYFLKKRASEQFNIECIVYANSLGFLGATEGAETLLEEIRKNSNAS